MNRWLEVVRWQDPVKIFSTFILKPNVFFEKRLDKYASMSEHALPKRVADMFDNSLKKSRKLSLRRHTRTLFHVQAGVKKNGWKTVDLEAMTCTCGAFREFEIQCKHMCAVLLSLNDEKLSRLIHQERLKDALVARVDYNSAKEQFRNI